MQTCIYPEVGLLQTDFLTFKSVKNAKVFKWTPKCICESCVDRLKFEDLSNIDQIDGAIGFGFASHSLQNWREPSLSVVIARTQLLSTVI